MSEKTKMIASYKYLGSQLIKNGVMFLNKAFNVQKVRYHERYILAFLKSVGVDNVYLPDRLYYLTSLKTMLSIIEYDLTDKYRYYSDYFDCDNFTDVFMAHVMETYGLNSVGRVGRIEMLKDGKHHAWHRANIFLTSDNGKISGYFYEPQTDKYIKLEKGKRYFFGNTEYKMGKTEFN
ncbi:MAG: hypothetical protein ACTSQE_06905 [Candidatus Heimdallarchaeaceae archaeon]